MVEGVSVLGGFDCTTWTLTAGRVTTVQDVDVDGVAFPAGITGVTALDHMSVIGFDVAGAGGSSAAVTITDASPVLSNDTVGAGRAATAIGLHVVESAGASAAPTITSGAYTAAGITGGIAEAVWIESASPAFSGVAIGGGAPSSATAATTSYGVNCTACSGTTFTNGSVDGGVATTTAYGLYASGDVTGLAVTGTAFRGGQTTGNGSTSYGVRLDTCTGAPTFTTATGFGGFPAGVGTTRTAFSTQGAACAPVIDGGAYRGCEAGVTCLGVDASAGSPIVIRNVNPAAGGAAFGITATNGVVDTGYGVRCTGGACASITSSTIGTGNLTRSGPTGVGLWIEGSSPTVDSCRITGPGGGTAGVAVVNPHWHGVYLTSTGATLTNNVVHDGQHAQRVFSMLYDMTGAGAGARGPLVANNTIDYAVCAACGARVGLVFFNNGLSAVASGVFRNNIVHNLGVPAGASSSNAVFEANVNSDPLTFENNALYDLTAAGGGVYVDEASMNLSTTIQLQALYGAASGDIVADCGVNGSFHIGGGSACLDTGTMMSCPPADFEGTVRPQGPACDIGCDEH
jgi:hypothetical protein